MTRFGSQYQVARSTGRCAATDRTFEPDEPCVATLCERETDDGFDRHDYAIEAWEAGHRPERLFSHWRTHARRTEERQRLLVDDDVLLDLFARLEDDDRPQRIAFRFVLALILMRKRLVRFEGTRTDTAGAEIWMMRPKGQETAVAVRNPKIADDDVRELAAQLSEILAGEF